MYVILSKHFFQTNKYNGFGVLLLISLDNVGKEMDEFRDSNSQLRCCVNDLKASCNHKNEIAEKQIQISFCNWLTTQIEFSASWGMYCLHENIDWR